MAATYLSEAQINAQVVAEMFDLHMISPTSYSLKHVPENLSYFYRDKNTFLIAEYGAYAARSDALLRHMWYYLASMMPFELPRDKNFDYYRARFKSDVDIWGYYADSYENSIKYWLNYPYKDNALKELYAKNQADRRFDYLSLEDEEKMNRVMKEIDPSFIPVNTMTTDWRIWQERQTSR